MSFSARLGELRFRASDRYDLVLHDRLRPEERRRFDELTKDPEHWGVLRPRGGGTYRAVDRDTALLLLTLREPGPLPAYVFGSGDRRLIEEQVRAMLLDGILLAETDDGQPANLLEEDEPRGVPDLDTPSRAALRYGMALAELGLDDPRELAIRMYVYGGEPVCRSICDRLASRREVLAYLRLAPGGAVRRRIPAGWRLDTRRGKGWIFLRRDEAGRVSADAGSRGRCKLYVACRFTDVPRVMAAVVSCLGDSGAKSMKVGSSVVDLVRTDKIVVYFEAFEALQRFAAELSGRLREVALPERGSARGVPFTAPAGAGGLLSWGVDPPAEAIPLKGTFSESWRAWVAARLAASLVSTRDSVADRRQRLRAVLERVRLDGVDPSRWTPDARLWSDTP